MAEAVGCYKIVVRLAGGDGADHLLEAFVVGEGKEHRLDVGVVYLHVAHAVVLLVAACKLVFLDHAVHIVVHIGCHHDAVLCAAVHGLRVDIIMVSVVLHEPSVVAERPEILHGFAVNAFVMLVGA